MGDWTSRVSSETPIPVVAMSVTSRFRKIFRLPEGTSLKEAVKCVPAAITQASRNRTGIREILACGKTLAGLRFESNGEVKEKSPLRPCSM